MSDRRPTLHDVARRAGVSPRTVSRSVDNDPHVAPETKQRIAGIINELGYRRNENARALKAGDRTSTIALVTEDLANPFYSAIARALGTAAAEYKTDLFVASSEEDPDREQVMVLGLLGRRVDGIVLVPTASDHTWLQREIDSGTAVVCVDRPAPGLSVDTVVLDNAAGSAAAVGQLLLAGHQRIALLGDDSGIWTVQQRMDGYRRALTSAGVRIDPQLLSLNSRTPVDAARAVDAMMRLEDPPTAVFCINNRITLGAVLRLAALDRRLDVAGFDDFESSALAPWPLTLATYDATEMGRQAAELLFDRINHPAGSPPRHVVVPVTLLQIGRGA